MQRPTAMLGQVGYGAPPSPHAPTAENEQECAALIAYVRELLDGSERRACEQATAELKAELKEARAETAELKAELKEARAELKEEQKEARDAKFAEMRSEHAEMRLYNNAWREMEDAKWRSWRGWRS